MTIVCLDFVSRRISTLDGTPGPGLPPAGPVVTSLLYPLEVVEGVDVGASFEDGWWYEPTDQIDVSASLVSGTLTETIVYKTLPTPDDAIDVVADLVSGDLQTVIAYKTIPTVDDAIDVSASLESGTLVATINYVTYTDPADDEGFDVSASLESGTLT